MTVASSSCGQSGRGVVVTGGAGQLGAWIAERFAGAGDRVWLIDHDEAALARVDAMIGAAARTSVIDLSIPDQIDRLISEIETAWGSPDIVINNAGIYPSLALLDADAAAWDRLLDVNLKAAHLMTRGAAKMMIAKGVAGCVINLTSRSARMPRPDGAVYAVSKAGLEMLTRGYAMELASHGIRVNAVSPGLIPGGKESDLTEAYLDAAKANIPLGRFSGPQDAPAAIEFLCSQAASFITGTTIFVDGGSTAGDFRLPKQNEASSAGKAGEKPC